MLLAPSLQLRVPSGSAAVNLPPTVDAPTDHELMIAVRAGEICGECVPREYAPELKIWMNRIQADARDLTADG